MVTVVIKGLGNASVKGAAKRFSRYCASEGVHTSPPVMGKHAKNFVDNSVGLPKLIGRNIQIYTAEIRLASEESVIIQKYPFPNTVNITVDSSQK